MTSVARALAALAIAAGTWCALGSLAVFSPTSAATRVGVLPPWGIAAALLVLAGAITWRVRRASSRALPLLLLPLFLLLPGINRHQFLLEQFFIFQLNLAIPLLADIRIIFVLIDKPQVG